MLAHVAAKNTLFEGHVLVSMFLADEEARRSLGAGRNSSSPEPISTTSSFTSSLFSISPSISYSPGCIVYGLYCKVDGDDWSISRFIMFWKGWRRGIVRTAAVADESGRQTLVWGWTPWNRTETQTGHRTGPRQQAMKGSVRRPASRFPATESLLI